MESDSIDVFAKLFTGWRILNGINTHKNKV